MKDISDAADLVATAHEALLRDVLPRLPKEGRYVGLMIANAMAIARRELASGASSCDHEARGIAQLLALDGVGQSRASELPELRRALVTAIRSGAFDAGPARVALQAHLEGTTAAWVAISNPKALR